MDALEASAAEAASVAADELLGDMDLDEVLDAQFCDDGAEVAVEAAGEVRRDARAETLRAVRGAASRALQEYLAEHKPQLLRLVETRRASETARGAVARARAAMDAATRMFVDATKRLDEALEREAAEKREHEGIIDMLCVELERRGHDPARVLGEDTAEGLEQLVNPGRRPGRPKRTPEQHQRHVERERARRQRQHADLLARRQARLQQAAAQASAQAALSGT